MLPSANSIFAVGLSLLATVAAAAAPTPLKPSQSWTGYVADATLEKQKPVNGVITNAADFEKLIKAWMVAEKTPDVDFTKDLVLVETTVGSRLNLNASLDENGDLKALGIATRDLRPGFRFVIISVPKEGVKSVNGKALPK